MKKIFLLGLVCLSFQVFGQGNYKEMPEKERKALEKEWKTKLKKMDVLEYKQLSEEFTRLRAEAGKMSGQIREAAKVLEEKDVAAMNLRRQVDSLRNLASGRSVAVDNNEIDAADNQEYGKGLVFKVQVGLNKKIDKSFMEANKQYDGELDETGNLVYTIAQFRRYEEADDFKIFIRKKGVSDAKVTAYMDSKAMKMEDALPLYKYQNSIPDLKSPKSDEGTSSDW